MASQDGTEAERPQAGPASLGTPPARGDATAATSPPPGGISATQPPPDGTAATAPPPDGTATQVLTVEGPSVEVRAALSQVRHPHLAPVAGAEADGTEAVGPVGGHRLDELRAASGPFTEEETATVVVPIAQALGALHGAGLVHGGLDETRVVVRPDGMPVLADLRRVRQGGHDAREDLHALIACAARLLPDEEVYVAAGVGTACLRAQLLALLDQETLTAADLVDACFRSVDPTPLRRPLARCAAQAQVHSQRHGGTAREDDERAEAPQDVASRAAQMLRAAARAEPDDAPPGRSGRRTRRGRRGSPPRRVRARLLVGLGLLAVAGAAWTGLRLWHPARTVETALAALATTAADGGASASAQPDPALAAVELTQRRAELLADPGAADLTQVEVVDGPAYRADQATVADLAGVRNVGLQVDVQDVSTRSVGADGAARVRLTWLTSGFVRTAADGAVSQVPAAGARTVELELRWTTDGWRVWSVSGSTTP